MRCHRLLPLCLMLAAPAAPVRADTPLSCDSHAATEQRLLADGFYLAMAEVLRDDHTRRLEAFYQPQTCQWTLLVVTLIQGRVEPSSTTCLLGEGDPGVCIPPG